MRVSRRGSLQLLLVLITSPGLPSRCRTRGCRSPIRRSRPPWAWPGCSTCLRRSRPQRRWPAHARAVTAAGRQAGRRAHGRSTRHSLGSRSNSMGAPLRKSRLAVVEPVPKGVCRAKSAGSGRRAWKGAHAARASARRLSGAGAGGAAGAGAGAGGRQGSWYRVWRES